MRALLLVALLGSSLAAAGTLAAPASDWPAETDGRFEHPVHIESRVDDGRLEGEVWSVAPGRFAEVAALLERPQSWCDIVTLHMNVKACVHYEDDEGHTRLVVYLGYQTFQTPEQAHALDARFALRREPERMVATLVAAEGPFWTYDHSLELVATPLADARTLLHFRYGHRFGWIAESAARLFLETWGRHRVGFSLDEERQPVRGFRGLVERNSVRYHLAIQAFLEHPHDREARWARWFELTERHPSELHELERSDYLANQRREHRESARLQARYDRSLPLGPTTR